ncbi:MAG: hypothetical protein ACO3UU_15420 [Minisyncoccia bacterium]
MDLIDELSAFSPETEVHLQYDSGDYWKTQIAPKISYIETGLIEYSRYHRTNKVVEYNDRQESERKEVVLIG